MNAAATTGMGGGARQGSRNIRRTPPNGYRSCARPSRTTSALTLWHWRLSVLFGRAATARSLGSSGFQRFFPDPYEVPVKSRTRLSRLMTKP